MEVMRYSEGVTAKSHGNYDTLLCIPKILMTPSIPTTVNYWFSKLLLLRAV